MKIALASPTFPKSIEDGLFQLQSLSKAASAQQAEIICFPETFIPGYPQEEYNVQKATPEDLQSALRKASIIAKENQIAIILPMDWYENDKFLNVAFVISKEGEVLGYQSKNQLDPTEDTIWSAGSTRQLFEINNVKFGIVICHEGFRYPESVRWAAMRGASIVFHPYLAGSDKEGVTLTNWGDKNNPYYEKAMMMRSIENKIYFASVNYATKFQDAATSLIAPEGNCIAHQPYGESGVLVFDIDTTLATGILAKRFKKHLYYSES